MVWALKGVETLNLYKKRPKGFIFCNNKPTWKFREAESRAFQWSGNLSMKIKVSEASCAYLS